MGRTILLSNVAELPGAEVRLQFLCRMILKHVRNQTGNGAALKAHPLWVPAVLLPCISQGDLGVFHTMRNKSSDI